MEAGQDRQGDDAAGQVAGGVGAGVGGTTSSPGARDDLTRRMGEWQLEAAARMRANGVSPDTARALAWSMRIETEIWLRTPGPMFVVTSC